jgi:hypothetical protein
MATRSVAKVTLLMLPGISPTSDGGDQIGSGSVSGIGAASGSAGHAEQRVAFPELNLAMGCGGKHRVTWSPSAAGVAAPRRLGGAACAAFGRAGPWSVAGGDAYRESDFPNRCWSEAGQAYHSSGTGPTNSSG